MKNTSFRKNRYEVDSDNRLWISSPERNERLVADGEFVVNKQNLLSYKLREPKIWRRKLNLPQKIKYIGNWSLNSNHDLEFVLSKSKGQFKGERLSLKGEILDVESNALLFELTTREKSGRILSRILKVEGRWQADEDSRLSFLIKRKEFYEDSLSFQGSWQVNKRNLLIYRYKKFDFLTKRKLKRSLSFNGYWEITSNDRIAYILDKEANSYFSFKVQLESPNLVGKKGVIKYRVGIGVKGRRPGDVQIISLFGTWKIGRKRGISFEMDYGNGRIKRIDFGVSSYITKRDKVIFELRDTRGRSLGGRVSFERNFLKSKGKSYLRLGRSKRDSKIEAGMKIPW